MAEFGTDPQSLQSEKGANLLTLQFVDGLTTGSEAAKGHLKIHHKKSRAGCQRCRTRRVKCDEVHPMCGSCERHQAACVYGRDTPSTRSAPQANNRGNSDISTGSHNTPDNTGIVSADTKTLNVSESRTRRLLELRLLHHYNIQTCNTMLVPGDPVGAEAWIGAVPNLALKNDGLLYSLFALSALHIVFGEPQNLEMIETYQRYLDLSIQEHRIDVANLNKENSDAVCMTSSFLRITSFARLQDRPLVPYTPPLQWLDMIRGAMATFAAAWKWIGDDDNSIASRLAKRMPLVFDEKAKFAESNRAGLLHLLHRTEEDIAGEPWDAETEGAYESTISYIGCIWIAIKAKELPVEICRRLILFPHLVKSRFIELVKNQRLRAFAVLAHYFALLTSCKDVWWIGHAGQRELQALNSIISVQRPDYMSLPFELTDDYKGTL